MFETTLPAIEPRTTSGRLSLTAINGDDHLGRVAEARVEQTADARARVLSRVFGRFADQPGERDQRDRGEHEQERLARVGDRSTGS